MILNLASKYVDRTQNRIYSNLNDISKSNKMAGRLCAIPISILDVGLDSLRTILTAIECVAMAAINLVGAAFSDEYTLKHALAHTELTITSSMLIPVKLIMAPIKIVFQFFAIMIDPETVQPIDYAKPTFKRVWV